MNEKQGRHNKQGLIVFNNHNDSKILIPLERWRANGRKYRNVAIVAQNLLVVPATSTPSKRVFLICGLVDTAKGLILLGAFRYNKINKFQYFQK